MGLAPGAVVEVGRAALLNLSATLLLLVHRW